MIFLYIGPGMSGGIVAVILGVVLSVFAGIVSVLWYPIKKLIKKFKNKNEKH